MPHSTSICSNTITFYGDSIFDNRPYVARHEDTVEAWAAKLISNPTRMKAVDGHTTTDLLEILESLPKKIDPKESAVISIGGNDALQSRWVLQQPTQSVGLAFHELQPILNIFRKNYTMVLESLIEHFELRNLRVCTIYNGIPDLPTEARTALGLFNDIITEEAGLRSIRVIDLRVICAEPECYSDISSIEPSSIGAQRITEAVRQAFS